MYGSTLVIVSWSLFRDSCAYMRSGLNTGANSGARTGDAEARKKLRRFTGNLPSDALLDVEKQRPVYAESIRPGMVVQDLSQVLAGQNLGVKQASGS